jgi:hypothetical protein
VPASPAEKIVHATARNAPCPCGSGRKYKQCCAPKRDREARALGRYNIGAGLLDAGQPEDAIGEFVAARELDPGRPQIHNNLGLAFVDAGRLEEGESCLRRALELDPGLVDAYANLHALLVRRDRRAAIDCLERALALRPDDATLRFFLGQLLELSGDPRAPTLIAGAAQSGSLQAARADAWNYIRERAAGAPVVGTRAETFRSAVAAARVAGLVLEFGVHFGASLRQIAAIAAQDVHGFDSFRGLPEDWHREPRGSYSTEGVLPRMPPNVTLHAGWFSDTLPRFLAAHAGNVRLMHIDCDLYSSTRTVLGALADRMVPGTVLVFDEYLGNERWREDEFRAWQEAVAQHGWRYEYLCYSLYTKQAAVRLL